MTKTTKAYLAITLQSMIIGLSFIFVKVALQSADTLSLLAHRFTVAAIGIFIYRLFRPAPFRLSAADWLKIIPYSLPYPVLFFLFQTLGLGLIPSSEAGIAHAMAPVMTLIAARILLGERSGPLQKLLMALSVAGVIYINIMNGIRPGGHSSLGFLFILLSAASWAAYNVVIKKISRAYGVLTLVYVMSLTGCAAFNLASLIRHAANGSVASYFAPFASPSFVGAILYMGVLSSLGTSTLSTYALSHLQASRVGLFNNVSTVITILGGTLILHEPLYPYHYVGIAAVLAGAVGFNLIKTPRQ